MGWGLGGDVVIGSSSQAFPRSHSGQTASQRNAIHDLTGPRKNMLQDGGFVQVNRELHPQPHKARNIFPGVREGGLSPSCAFSVQARDLTDAVPPFLSSSPQVPSTCLTRVDKQDRCQIVISVWCLELSRSDGHPSDSQERLRFCFFLPGGKRQLWPYPFISRFSWGIALLASAAHSITQNPSGKLHSSKGTIYIYI